MSLLLTRGVIQVERLEDLLAHSDRADRVFYTNRGNYYWVICGSFFWEGEVREELRPLLERVLKVKGVRIKRIFDSYEIVDYLKSVLHE